MPKKRVKAKAKSKKKLKAKTRKTKARKLKAKVKPKAKRKVKSKGKAKSKSKSKAKTKSKVKSKARAKTKTKVKAKTKSKAKSKTKLKAKRKSTAKTKVSAKSNYTDMQKANLVESIRRIVDLRKRTVEGLKSLDALDHILDQYNQKYTQPTQKFDAIIEYAIVERDNFVSDSGLIALKDKGRDSVALYALLSDIGKGKVQFEDAHDELNAIYLEAMRDKIYL